MSSPLFRKAYSLATSTTILSKATLEELLDVERLKHCYECGICTGSCPMTEILGDNYNPRSLLERILTDPDQAFSSDELWLCAWCYRCYKRCNQAIKVPEVFLRLREIASKKGFTSSSETAFRKIVENVPLPLTTTLACFHPERAGLQEEKTLEKIGQLYEEHLKSEKARRAQEVREERIAIIGSGPAGLTVAYELSRKGYGVTVYESLSQAGGMLRKCIPSFRLPRRYLDKDIQSIMDLGVEIKTGFTVGQDVNFNALWREGYKAIFVGAGAQKTQRLHVEGADLKGVIHALDFLWSFNSGETVEVGKKVVVIGGGNVAVDAARTALAACKALRTGAEDVTILYRRSRDEMPAIPWEVNEGEKEGVKIEFLVSPKKIVGHEGRACAVECVRMELGEPDETGRRRAVPIEGSKFNQEAETVILAVGEVPDLEFLPKEAELNDDGTVWTDPVTMETSMKGVFAGGDAVTGPATIIEAICAGKRAARSIEQYLTSLKS
jgi:NADPH-dependent glutamate synthase beta subunit-like oxidoreductase